MTAPRTIALLAVPGVQLLDVSGPLDVFAEARSQVRAAQVREASTRQAPARQARMETPLYQLRVIAAARGPILSSSGVRLMPDAVIGEKLSEPIDTLLVAGAPNADRTSFSPRLLDWVRTTAAKARRFGSVCSGAFVLAEAGLLDGKRVTTHWAVADRLARAYPSVSVEPDAIQVRDGRLRTAAGVTAGMDLALALVEEDAGRDIATRVAAQLVMYFKRPGGQMQFSRAGEAAPVGRSALQEVQRWVAAHPAQDHSLARLANRMGLSTRHFTRLFTHEVGVTPATWVEQIRIAAARRMLESQQAAPKQVASRCGFGDIDTFRRAFARVTGVTPTEYRKRFVDDGE